MTKSVTVRQAKYFMDRIKRNDLPYLKLDEHKVFDKVFDSISTNKVYSSVGQVIEDEAKKIVEEIKPSVEEVTKKINDKSVEINSTPKEEKEKIAKAKEELNALWDEYDKIYSDAQKKIDDFKIKTIVEDNRGVKLFDLTDKEYDTIDNIIHWTIDETPKESVAEKYESTVDDVK